MNRNNNILIKSVILLVLALGWGGSAWAQGTKTITLSFSNISATTATVNVSGTGAAGVTATVGRARENFTTDKNFFTGGAGYNDNILGVEYSNGRNDFWEVPITINGLSEITDYSLTTNMRLLNSAGNYQGNNTNRTWIETILVNGVQHATTGDVAFIRGDASESRTFVPFVGSAPLVLTIRMQRTDPNGCFSGIHSLTLTYEDNPNYLVRIKGDSPEGYTVTAGGATAKNGQRLDPANVPTGTDLRAIRIDAPANKHVWGPIVDHTAKTISFEVSDPVAPQAGRWYKVQVLPTNGVVTSSSTNNMVDALNSNIKDAGIRSNYMYLQNAPQPSNRSNYQSIHWFQGMPQKEAAGYIYVTSFNSNNIMFQHVNGRYIGNDGQQQTGVNNGSDVQLTLSNQGGYTNCYSWKHMRPWVLDGNDVAPYVGRASNSTNNFYSYFAEVDPTEKYDVYQVTVQGGNTNTTINYVGNASNSHGLDNIYNGGYLFFRKGYVPQSSDFTTSVSFGNQEIEITGATGIRQLLIRGSGVPNNFSPAPVDGQWAAGTKWFTIRNHRAGKYISVENSSVDDSYQLKWGSSAAEPTNPEGFWCFVQDGSNGFRIYNKAYGPDFAIQMTGTSTNSYLTMAHLSEIVSANSYFHFVDNTNTYNGYPEVCIIQGASGGGVGINSIGGTYPGVWSAGESNHRGDAGSAFYIHRVDESLITAAQEYTAYKVSIQPEGMDLNIPINFEYTPVGQLGAKTTRHTSNHYILIQQGVNPEASNFTSTMVPDGFTNLTRTTSTTNPAYEIITLTGKVVLPHVVHRPNGNLWRAKQNGYDGSSTNTVGTQTDYYTDVELENGETVKLQHTGVFEITHFLKPGETRQLWMPSTSSSANDKEAKILNYMRWFDYKTESMPDPAIVNLAADQAGSLYNSAWYYQNGIVVGASVNGVYPKRFVHINMPSSLTKDQVDYEYTLANEATRYNDFGNNFTSGSAAPGNASYLGVFTDPNNKAQGSKNLIEPTIGTRQIYHLRSAHEMATNLHACTGETWLEEETITFPTRGVNWNGYEDVIPLEYNFLDYWSYTTGGELTNVRDAGTTIKVDVQANGTGITKVVKNCNDFLSGSEVFAEANSNPSREAGHYVSFDYPSSGIIPIPEGMTSAEATICVYLDVNGTRYNIKKFTLVFQNNVEPVPYYEVLSDPGHVRSDKSLATQFGNSENPSGVYTQLNFHYENNYLMGLGGSPLTTGRGYYAFPYNFDEVSYSYFANGMAWCDWGEYGMRNNGATATHHASIGFNPEFLSVNYLRELYKKKTAQAELEAAQALLASAGDDEVQRAEAEYRISEANKLLSEVTTATLQAAYHNNYYIYVDASEQPGQVGRLRINEPLCTGTRIYGTAWLSASSAYTAGSPDPASVIFRFKGVRSDGSMTTIYSYCPGQISNVGRDKDRNEVYTHQEQRYDGTDYNEAIWQQVAFSFVNPYPANEFEGFVLEVFNNCRGSSGGDIFLDDIRLYVKTPQVNVDNAAPVCGDELSIVRISTDFDAMMDALQGNTHLGEDQIYHGTYAILDKEVYDSYLAGIASPTTDDVAEAFNLALMGETDKSKCYSGDTFLPEFYAFHNITFHSDYDAHTHVTYATLVGDNILETAGRMYQYSSSGEIISRNLVFNCKIADERVAGKKYYLVFHANVTPTDMSTMNKADYAEFFSMGDICCVRSEFQTMRAQMVKVEGSDELDPFNIDYCPGTAPTISLNSYGYDINGELIQEHGVYYDWYFGTKEQFKTERVWLDDADIDVENLDQYTDREIITAEDFCMEHCLLNFRHFYPTAGVNELYDGTVQIHHFEKDDDTDTEYELTEKMIAKLKEWVEDGRLRLHLTAVSVDLSAHDAQGDTHILAIQQGTKLRYEHTDTSKENPILYCIDPVEISFHTNLESPRAGVGMAGIDYSATPYDRDATSNVLHSIPVRVNMAQIRNIFQNDGVQLRVPLRSITPSGYYKEDDSHGNPVTTQKIHLTVDTDADDIVVVETNDPYWQMRKVDQGGGEYLPVVGKLRRIDADKARTEGVDYIWMDFNDESIHDRFDPREGYYYILRANFVENVNPGVTLSSSYEVPDVKCHGNILIPIKIVPEYMKWTGRESNDWNNDRNWVRADYRELVPSDAQNPDSRYAQYRANQQGSIGGSQAQGSVNGLPVSANDGVEEAKMDMYIPMDQPSSSSLYNTFAYAPMEDTYILIPTDCERYPSLTPHAIGTADGEKNLLLVGQPGETNTPWISYDMVARRSSETVAGQEKVIYACETYYENTVNNITFQPASQLVNAQYLTYNKAWVEYELKTGRWYTLSSPLQNTFAGEWYSPTAGGKQLTPQFYDITYQPSLNDRFRPAYYQRSWDSQGNNPVYLQKPNSDNKTEYSAYIVADWSHVYNDVKKEYSNGGFSVLVEDGYMDAPIDGKALVRLPKADTGYTYYDINGGTGQKADDVLPIYRLDESGAPILQQGANPSKLFTDKLKAAAEFTQDIANATEGNNFFLVGNPFMANLDMDKFFDANDQLEKKFWIMTEDGQAVSVKVDGSDWVGTTGSKVAPLQGFFVKGSGNSTTIHYTADMQADIAPIAPLKVKGRRSSALQALTIQATSGELTTTAIVALSEEASKEFVGSEDAETFIDSNIADQPTLYTVASGQAMTVNTVPAFDMIPLGVVGKADALELTFSGIDGDLYLYDSLQNEYTEIREGTRAVMDANSAGRYYITAAQLPTHDAENLNADAAGRKGVWTLSGQYCGTTVKGLAPGIYIVNGVKMQVR